LFVISLSFILHILNILGPRFQWHSKGEQVWVFKLFFLTNINIILYHININVSL